MRTCRPESSTSAGGKVKRCSHGGRPAAPQTHQQRRTSREPAAHTTPRLGMLTAAPLLAGGTWKRPIVHQVLDTRRHGAGYPALKCTGPVHDTACRSPADTRHQCPEQANPEESRPSACPEQEETLPKGMFYNTSRKAKPFHLDNTASLLKPKLGTRSLYWEHVNGAAAPVHGNRHACENTALPYCSPHPT